MYLDWAVVLFIVFVFAFSLFKDPFNVVSQWKRKRNVRRINKRNKK